MKNTNKIIFKVKNIFFIFLTISILIFNVLLFPKYYYSQLEKQISYKNCIYWKTHYTYTVNDSQKIWLIIDTIDYCLLTNHKDFLISQLKNHNTLTFSTWSTLATPSKISDKALIVLNKLYNMNKTKIDWISNEVH